MITDRFILHFLLCLFNSGLATTLSNRSGLILYGLVFVFQIVLYILEPDCFYIVVFSAIPCFISLFKYVKGYFYGS